MKISRTMQEVISKLAEKHGLDLMAQEARLRLDMEGFDRLVIEKIATHLVGVGHYYEQRGDLVADPEIVFFISDIGWVPTEITQVLGGHRIYSIVADGGQDVAVIDPRRQADLASFAEMWARNIESQGWLEDAEKWDQEGLEEPDKPVRSQAPDLETLMAWESEGGCEATDGCWTDPDGVCPHGHQSWLLELGLI